MTTSSTFDPGYFPDTLAECHHVISELRAEVKRLQAIEAVMEELTKKVANLETQLKNQKRARFGKSSAQVATATLTGTGKIYYEESSRELEEKSAALAIVPEEKARGGGRTAPQSAVVETGVAPNVATGKVLGAPSTHMPSCLNSGGTQNLLSRLARRATRRAWP